MKGEKKMRTEAEAKELIESLKPLQEKKHPFPCPRCGHNSMDVANPSRNALSRYVDVYICARCGMDEALRDYCGADPIPLTNWGMVLGFDDDDRREMISKSDIDRFELCDLYSNDHPEAEDGMLSTRVECPEVFDYVLDDIRKSAGEIPLYDESGECADDGWYDFWVELTVDTVDGMFGCVSEESGANVADTGTAYEIPLSEEQKSWMFERIRNLFGEERWEGIFQEAGDED